MEPHQHRSQPVDIERQHPDALHADPKLPEPSAAPLPPADYSAMFDRVL